MTDEKIEELYRHNIEECEACMKKLDFKREQELEFIKEAVRKETAKDILTEWKIDDDESGAFARLLILSLARKYGVVIGELGK